MSIPTELWIDFFRVKEMFNGRLMHFVKLILDFYGNFYT